MGEENRGESRVAYLGLDRRLVAGSEADGGGGGDDDERQREEDAMGENGMETGGGVRRGRKQRGRGWPGGQVEGNS